MAVEGAELDFNAWTAVIVKNLFESARLLTNTMPLFADKCLRGMQVRTEHNRLAAESSLGLSTVVGGVYGYDAAARAAHHAVDHGMSIKEAVIDLGTAPRETVERLLDPVVLTDGARSSSQEEQATRVVAEALELAGTTPATGNDLPADLSSLDEAERRLVYACAAWLAGADSVTAAAETELLTSLRLEPETADTLQSKVDDLRA